MLQLSDNPQETLTNNLWQQWKSVGYIERPNSLTWMELNNLTGYFLNPTYNLRNNNVTAIR